MKEKSAFFWHDLQKLHTAACGCHNKGSSEPEWNDEVHSQVLHLTLEFTCATSQMWYRNVTTNHIWDNSLLPTQTGSGAQSTAKMQSKMLDFAMMVKLDEKLSAAILCVLKEGSSTNS